MQSFTKTIADMQEMAKSTQSVYAIMPATGVHGSHFWQAQDTYLKEFEKFSSAWFKRRHDGTRTAMQTSKRLTEDAIGDPVAAMGILAEWQSHSMERLAEDARDYMEMLTGCASAAVSNEIEAVEESVKTAKRATKTVKSDPV